MNSKSTIVGLMGLGLVGAHFTHSNDGKTISQAITDSSASPSGQAHASFMKLAGALLFVVVATIAAAGSDNAGNVFIGFFLLLWAVYLMGTHTNISGPIKQSLPQFGSNLGSSNIK